MALCDAQGHNVYVSWRHANGYIIRQRLFVFHMAHSPFHL
ncbi:uncharacterized protein G2W53_017018 [Senna tora]|uniref:Uncharacterized protein n=1 Tax=Senna tora TaxID=362788 RepID=A0A834TXJ6_9FABA|nr:uncharacterized protein G2W53_017018 [Senna tora]